MESIELVQRLKDVIESDLKGYKDELEQERVEAKALKEKNEELSRTILELKEDNSSLVKALKDLKEKYNRLLEKLKRKQEEINKKETWWDKYRFTAETTLKKLRTLGTFSPDVLHEVSRDLVDIMEDGSSTESVSSQDSKGKKTSLKKLTTSKGKKKFRYAEISPDNLNSNTRQSQQKQIEIKPGDENLRGKNHTDSQRSSGSGSKPEVEQKVRKAIVPEDSDETNAYHHGCPSSTSTPLLTSTQTKLSSAPIDFPDLSIISKKSTGNVNVHNKVSKKLAKDAKSVALGKDNRGTLNHGKVIHDKVNDVYESDIQSPSILDNIEKETYSTNSNARNEEGWNCPSRLAEKLKARKAELQSKEARTEKQTPDRKRLSSSGMSGVKRKRIDEEDRKQGCVQHPSRTQKQSDTVDPPDQASVVLLSSGEEDDDAKMGSSSVDMFGEGEKSHSNNLTKDKDAIIDTIERDSQVRNKNVATSSNMEPHKEKAKDDECSSKYLDEEFPGFRKPDEPSYKNIQVVRKKGERAKLKGFSCRDCAEYYSSLNLNESELKKRQKYCSRHRAKHSPPPSTPPGFWNLSFPTTQEYMKDGLLITEEHLAPQKIRRPRRRRQLAKAPVK